MLHFNLSVTAFLHLFCTDTMLVLHTESTKDISPFHQIFIFLTQSLQGGAAYKSKQFRDSSLSPSLRCICYDLIPLLLLSSVAT